MSETKPDSAAQAKPGTKADPDGTAKPAPGAQAGKSGAAAKPGAATQEGLPGLTGKTSAPARSVGAALGGTSARSAVAAQVSASAAPAEAAAKPSPKSRPKPQAKPAPKASPEERRTQFVRVYLKHRVGERLDSFERGRVKYTSARRWTGALSVVLLAGAAALGAIAAADATRRPMWGFLAAVVAALAVAVAWYESAFGLRRLARRSTSAAALLEILQAHGAPSDEDGVAAFVTEVESVLRHSD